MSQVLTVLTFKSAEHLLADGGTQSWVLNRKRALTCRYVVCARHRQGPWKAEGPEPHKHAFLVGRIDDIVPSSENASRWCVMFSEYALLNGPKLPLESASPTQYFPTLKSLGIDEAALHWQTLASSASAPPSTTLASPARAATARTPAQTLNDAKAMVATAFGVAPEAIEIIVRA
ncbi:hypothetical protein [Phenylobacterium sp.]|jgi:hypothetical protein|uniref:hypothetical protein n=1 Tax=Phenylobacterium sp. TaxID=1871053 RepID=UPI002F94C684